MPPLAFAQALGCHLHPEVTVASSSFPFSSRQTLEHCPQEKPILAPAPCISFEDIFLRGIFPGVTCGGGGDWRGCGGQVLQEQFASVDKCCFLRSHLPFLLSSFSSCEPSLLFFLPFLQFAKSVVIWCQQLIQAEGRKREWGKKIPPRD